MHTFILRYINFYVHSSLFCVHLSLVLKKQGQQMYLQDSLNVIVSVVNYLLSYVGIA